jgi:hypothetical protein
MFQKDSGDIPGYVIADLLGDSKEQLSSNRDDLSDYNTRKFIENLSQGLIKDPEEELRKRRIEKSPPHILFKGAGSFIAPDMQRRAKQETRTRVTAKGEAKIENQEDLIKNVRETNARVEQKARDEDLPTAGVTSSDTVKEIIENIDFKGVVHIENVIDHAIWTPDFLHHREPFDHKIPSKFHPQKMTPAVFKLAKVWAAFVKDVFMRVNAKFEPYCVGFCFSEDARAMYMNNAKDQHGNVVATNLVMINPFKDVHAETDIWSASNVEDLEYLYSFAIHECSHFTARRDSWEDRDAHGKAFAIAITENIALTAGGWRRMRSLAAVARGAEDVAVDAPRAGATVRKKGAGDAAGEVDAMDKELTRLRKKSEKLVGLQEKLEMRDRIRNLEILRNEKKLHMFDEPSEPAAPRPRRLFNIRPSGTKFAAEYYEIGDDGLEIWRNTEMAANADTALRYAQEQAIITSKNSDIRVVRVVCQLLNIDKVYIDGSDEPFGSR